MTEYPKSEHIDCSVRPSLGSEVDCPSPVSFPPENWWIRAASIQGCSSVSDTRHHQMICRNMPRVNQSNNGATCSWKIPHDLQQPQSDSCPACFSVLLCFFFSPWTLLLVLNLMLIQTSHPFFNPVELMAGGICCHEPKQVIQGCAEEGLKPDGFEAMPALPGASHLFSTPALLYFKPVSPTWRASVHQVTGASLGALWGDWDTVSVVGPFCGLDIFACSPNVPCYNIAVTPSGDVRACWSHVSYCADHCPPFCVLELAWGHLRSHSRELEGKKKSLTAITANIRQTNIGKGQQGLGKQRYERKEMPFWEEKWQEMGMQQAGSQVRGPKHASAGFESLILKAGLQSWKAPK